MNDNVVQPKSVDSSFSKTKKTIKVILPWIISGGLIAFVVLTEDMGKVISDFGEINLIVFFAVTIPFLCILLLIETIFLVIGFRWFAGVGQFGDLFRARAATYLLTVISIFVGLGGLVVYGKRRYGVSYSLGTTIVLNELLHELASQCTLALMVGLLLPSELIPEAALPAVKGVTIVGMTGVGIYILILISNTLFKYPLKKYRMNNLLDNFVDISLKQYAIFYFTKLIQNILYGLFLAGVLVSFSIKPPVIVSVGFMQIIHLTRAIPVSAFGIGVDQIAIKYLFEAWAPSSTGLLLACSGVFTFTLVIGRALLGVPFLKGVFDDFVEDPKKNE